LPPTKNPEFPISEDLVLACRGIPDMEAFQYELSVSVEKVVK